MKRLKMQDSDIREVWLEGCAHIAAVHRRSRNGACRRSAHQVQSWRLNRSLGSNRIDHVLHDLNPDGRILPNKNGSQIGVAVALGMSTALLNKHLKAGLVVAGGVTLGGSIEPVHDPVSVVELAVEKGASSVLMPVSARRQLIDLSDDMATKVDVQYYADLRDALLKGILE